MYNTIKFVSNKIIIHIRILNNIKIIIIMVTAMAIATALVMAMAMATKIYS
mgnify:CR=1 FL=1